MVLHTVLKINANNKLLININMSSKHKPKRTFQNIFITKNYSLTPRHSLL